MRYTTTTITTTLSPADIQLGTVRDIINICELTDCPVLLLPLFLLLSAFPSSVAWQPPTSERRRPPPSALPFPPTLVPTCRFDDDDVRSFLFDTSVASPMHSKYSLFALNTVDSFLLYTLYGYYNRTGFVVLYTLLLRPKSHFWIDWLLYSGVCAGENCVMFSDDDDNDDDDDWFGVLVEAWRSAIAISIISLEILICVLLLFFYISRIYNSLWRPYSSTMLNERLWWCAIDLYFLPRHRRWPLSRFLSDFEARVSTKKQCPLPSYVVLARCRC